MSRPTGEELNAYEMGRKLGAQLAEPMVAAIAAALAAARAEALEEAARLVEVTDEGYLGLIDSQKAADAIRALAEARRRTGLRNEAPAVCP